MSQSQPAPEASGPAPQPYPAAQFAQQPAQPSPYGPTPEPVTDPPERVLRGLGLSLLAIPVGAALAGVIWSFGYIAAISSLVLAALAAVLYARGSGGRIRKGIPVIIGVVLVGAVVSFFTVVGVDLVQTYQSFSASEQGEYGTLPQFVAGNLFYGPVLSAESKNLGLMLLFSALGAFGTIFRLVRARR